MDKELARYINTLLAERERELKKEDLSYKECLEQKNLNPKAEFNSEKFFAWGQELSWEKAMIYRGQKAMDYFEEVG